MLLQEELTESELYDLLANHTLANFDPVAEAFKVSHTPHTPHHAALPALSLHLPFPLTFHPFPLPMPQLYDPAGTGALDPEVLRGFLVQFGLTDLTKGDLATLLDLSDRDKDGRVNLSDFRKMLTHPR